MTDRVILLTGFGAFPGVPVNPSARLVRHLAAGPRVPGVRLVAAVLPVVLDGLAARLDHLIETHRPAAVVMIGVYADRDRTAAVRVEETGYNWLEASIPDAGGQKFPGMPMVEGAAATAASTLPIDPMITAFAGQDVPARRSADPGRYLCNAALYHGQRRLAGSGVPSGFIHVPPAEHLAVDLLVPGFRAALAVVAAT